MAKLVVMPGLGPEVARRDRADFLASVDDLRTRARLDAADDRFAEVLEQYPDQRARWRAFQAERTWRRIRRWLEVERVREPAASPAGPGRRFRR